MASVNFTVTHLDEEDKVIIGAKWADVFTPPPRDEKLMPVYNDFKQDFDRIPDDLDHKTIRVTGSFLESMDKCIGQYDEATGVLYIGDWQLCKVGHDDMMDVDFFEQMDSDFPRETFMECTVDEWNTSYPQIDLRL